MHYYCNPLNVPYKYQRTLYNGKGVVYREAADPTLVRYNGKYLLFPSMTGGFYASDDMASWEFHPFRQQMPISDYAPDVRVIDGWLYFCASTAGRSSDFYRTKDVFNGFFERIPGSFPFWDPDMFEDDDGRLYFYWGCSNDKPIYGVELDKSTMRPLGEPVELLNRTDDENGYERHGEDHSTPGNRPYMEGAYMTKHGGRYYLQYAIPGTEFNIYCDGVYVSDHPLGPFTLCKSNPFSYFPGGFITGAGHGSTIADENGAYWHVATMRISENHMFERRLGLWRAGFDEEGNPYCDQRYGDWPMAAEDAPFSLPRWLPLHVGARASASSGQHPENALTEDVRSWWSAETNEPGQWLQADLGAECSVHAVQINFADEGMTFETESGDRVIDLGQHFTRWKLEASADGHLWQTLCDKTQADTDLSHDFIVREEGVRCRFIRLTVIETPYGQPARVSGLRIFGKAEGSAPAEPTFTAQRLCGTQMRVSWTSEGALGANILWGLAPDKLYHSYLVYGDAQKTVSALMSSNREYWVRIDSFNRSGITIGKAVCIKEVSE